MHSVRRLYLSLGACLMMTHAAAQEPSSVKTIVDNFVKSQKDINEKAHLLVFYLTRKCPYTIEFLSGLKFLKNKIKEKLTVYIVFDGKPKDEDLKNFKIPKDFIQISGEQSDWTAYSAKSSGQNVLIQTDGTIALKTGRFGAPRIKDILKEFGITDFKMPIGTPANNIKGCDPKFDPTMPRGNSPPPQPTGV